MIRTYPRIPTTVATGLLVELSAVAAAEGVKALERRSATSHPRQEFYATADRHGPDHLADVRRRLRRVAEDCGYPAALKGKGDHRSRTFDRMASEALLDVLEIAPVDAGQDGVWSFLSLVLLPDLSLWRWPNIRERDDYERLLGRPRNVFRRLWWRAYCLGPEASRLLLEDEVVAIMERSSLGGDPRLAKALARRHLEAVRSCPEVSRTEVLREATKRLRRFTTILSLAVLPDSQLESLVGEVVDDAVTVLRYQLRARHSTDARSS